MLEAGIQDARDNITRFLVLSRDPAVSAPGDAAPHKTSLAFALPEGPGRLFKALSVFALRGLDICKARGLPPGLALTCARLCCPRCALRHALESTSAC